MKTSSFIYGWSYDHEFREDRPYVSVSLSCGTIASGYSPSKGFQYANGLCNLFVLNLLVAVDAFTSLRIEIFFVQKSVSKASTSAFAVSLRAFVQNTLMLCWLNVVVGHRVLRYCSKASGEKLIFWNHNDFATIIVARAYNFKVRLTHQSYVFIRNHWQYMVGYQTLHLTVP